MHKIETKHIQNMEAALIVLSVALATISDLHASLLCVPFYLLSTRLNFERKTNNNPINAFFHLIKDQL